MYICSVSGSQDGLCFVVCCSVINQTTSWRVCHMCGRPCWLAKSVCCKWYEDRNWLLWLLRTCTQLNNTYVRLLHFKVSDPSSVTSSRSSSCDLITVYPNLIPMSTMAPLSLSPLTLLPNLLMSYCRIPTPSCLSLPCRHMFFSLPPHSLHIGHLHMHA